MWGKTNIAERCATYGQNPLAGIEVMWGLKTKATSLPISWSESPGGD